MCFALTDIQTWILWCRSSGSISRSSSKVIGQRWRLPGPKKKSFSMMCQHSKADKARIWQGSYGRRQLWGLRLGVFPKSATVLFIRRNVDNQIITDSLLVKSVNVNFEMRVECQVSADFLKSDVVLFLAPAWLEKMDNFGCHNIPLYRSYK